MTGYNLCLIEGSEEVCTLVSADTLSYTFDNLNPETDYSIRISAVNANGEGPFSGGSFTTGNYICLFSGLIILLIFVYRFGINEFLCAFFHLRHYCCIK